jgi:Ca-activated chloride channel homolog
MRFALMVMVLAAPAALSAQGRLIPVCPTARGDDPVLMVRCPTTQIVRFRSDVRARLTGRVVRYEITEQFVNRGGRIGEADYLFPLPDGAAFRDLQLSINGQLVSGETMNATQARAVYEEIVRRLRDPALVEWIGSGLLRTRIFPIEPGEVKKIVLSYEAVVPREGDALRIDYSGGYAGQERLSGMAPVGTPIRRTAGAGAATGPAIVEADRDVKSSDSSDGERSSFTLTYSLNGELGDVYSPTSALDVQDIAGERVVRVLGETRAVTLLVPLRLAGHAAISILTHATRGGERFAMITVSPPASHGAQTPRDVTFVLDVSGSMSGQKIEQARAAGKELLATLRTTDRFRLIDFSSSVDDFHDGFTSATHENIVAATRYLDGLTAGGGTNIAGALDDALRPDDVGMRDTGRLGVVLFITDGMPTVGECNADSIAERAAGERGDRRVFTFGLGTDVNAALLEELALEGRGTAQFVRPNEDVERAVGIVASRLEDPVATDLRVRVEGADVQLRDIVPMMPVDLFAGQDLVLLARYSGSGTARVVVEGNAHGHPVRWESDGAFARATQDNGFVPRLWAAQQIGYLSAERRRHGGSPELDDAIRALGESYGIPTEFTAYLVQEPQATTVGVNIRRRDAAAGMPMVPSPATSAANFEEARLASAQRSVKSVAALDSLSVAAGATDGANARIVNGHAFMQRGGRWVDSRLTDSTRVIPVQEFSKSYFALLDRIPELRSMAALGSRVVMVGRHVAIEIVPHAPELSAADLDLAVHAW